MRFQELRERGTDGTLHVQANERDLYLRESAVYSVEGGRCRTTSGEMAGTLSSALGAVPAGSLAALAYGVAVDGVPRAAARRAGAEDDGTERWEIDWTIDGGVASRRIRGEVWLDSQGRAVRSRGTSSATTVGGAPVPETSWEYAVTRIGESFRVEPPATCAQAGVIAAGEGVGALPRLPGARVTMEAGQRLAYTAAGALDEAVAFHVRELGAAGWTVAPEQRIGTMSRLQATKPGASLVVVVMGQDDGNVSVILSPE